ncbi:hypothetical protein QKW52_00075 [Bacillus sonorensis]|nr:hypothetical protein [Bacillus sonorensis]
MDFLKSAMDRVKPEFERLIRRELGKMTKTNEKFTYWLTNHLAASSANT